MTKIVSRNFPRIITSFKEVGSCICLDVEEIVLSHKSFNRLLYRPGYGLTDDCKIVDVDDMGRPTSFEIHDGTANPILVRQGKAKEEK